MQGISKHMKGMGEPEWTPQDDDDTFGESSNLLNPKVWSTGTRKERFKLALVDQLFDHLLVQQSYTEKNKF